MQSQSTFEPTTFSSDGDLIIRSSDGVDFRVHSLLLRLGSDVFDSMLSVPQPTASSAAEVPTVDLVESAEIIDTFLRWIYPIRDKPTINSLDELAALLPSAIKYEIHPALVALYSCWAVPLAPSVLEDPLRAYAIAVKYGLLDQARAVARLVIVQNLKLLEVEPKHELREITWPTMKRLNDLRVECIHQCGDIFRNGLQSPPFQRPKIRASMD